MKYLLNLGRLLVVAGLVGGCQSASRTTPAAATAAPVVVASAGVAAPAAPVVPETTVAPVAKPKTAPPRRVGPKAMPGAPAKPALRAGEVLVRIESVPSGAPVIRDGRPVGKTPCDLIIEGNVRGFFREQLSLKVRFIATDSAQGSHSVEEVFTPLDKIPAAVSFTAEGARRSAR